MLLYAMNLKYLLKLRWSKLSISPHVNYPGWFFFARYKKRVGVLNSNKKNILIDPLGSKCSY